MERMKEWKFQPVLNLQEILARLQEQQPAWGWHMRDSEVCGDYLSGYFDGVYTRITEHDDRWCYEFRIRAEATVQDWDSLIVSFEETIAFL